LHQEIHQSPDELLSKFDETVSFYKNIPPWNLLTTRTGTSEKTWKKFAGTTGNWIKEITRKYAEWLRENNPHSPNLEIALRSLQNTHKPELETGNSSSSQKSRTPKYEKTEGGTVGNLIHFNNMTHAPVNEQGVIFLFGMVSKALGFESIVSVGYGFPDCRGYWKVGNGKLQYVEIEFEYKSIHYKDHVHPFEGPYVIVCWEHNWRDCPSSIKVIELKKEIEKLRNNQEFKSLS
jgi:hypothetical protein